jgi:hypothetical protein
VSALTYNNDIATRPKLFQNKYNVTSLRTTKVRGPNVDTAVALERHARAAFTEFGGDGGNTRRATGRFFGAVGHTIPPSSAAPERPPTRRRGVGVTLALSTHTHTHV